MIRHATPRDLAPGRKSQRNILRANDTMRISLTRNTHLKPSKTPLNRSSDFVRRRTSICPVYRSCREIFRHSVLESRLRDCVTIRAIAILSGPDRFMAILFRDRNDRATREWGTIVSDSEIASLIVLLLQSPALHCAMRRHGSRRDKVRVTLYRARKKYQRDALQTKDQCRHSPEIRRRSIVRVAN